MMTFLDCIAKMVMYFMCTIYWFGRFFVATGKWSLGSYALVTIILTACRMSLLRSIGMSLGSYAALVLIAALYRAAWSDNYKMHY